MNLTVVRVGILNSFDIIRIAARILQELARHVIIFEDGFFEQYKGK
jgi:hypothetical protein